MDWGPVLVGLHLLGFALGLGGATVSDVTFFRTLRSRALSEEKYAFLKNLSTIIWVGLWLAIFSGLGLFYLIYAEQGSLPMLAAPRWQAKLTLVGIILVNGIFFRQAIFPALGRLVGQALSLANVGPIVWKLALSGTISILSWYSVLIVTQLPRTFRPHILYFAAAYLALLIIGFLFSRFVIRRTLG